MNKGTSDMIDAAMASRQVLSMQKGLTNRTMKNGAILLEAKPAKGRAGGTIVLALIPWNLATPFVTWWMNEEGDTFGGDYVTTVAAGLKSFEGRSG